MTVSQTEYERIEAWVKRYLGNIHRTVLGTVVWVIVCLLVAERLPEDVEQRYRAALDQREPVEQSTARKLAQPTSAIDLLGLPPRIRNALGRSGITSIAAVRAAPDADLLGVRGIGDRALRAIRSHLRLRDQIAHGKPAARGPDAPDARSRRRPSTRGE